MPREVGSYMHQKRQKIALIFNANKAYDRGVICGIGEYFQSSHCNWEIYIEEDFSSHNRAISADNYDGIIADFDNPYMAEKLKDTHAIIVGLGSSYLQDGDYPVIPYVATDNQKLVEEALNHLRKKRVGTLCLLRISGRRAMALVEGPGTSISHHFKTTAVGWFGLCGV